MTKKKTKAERGLLQHILRSEQDKQIEHLREENDALSAENIRLRDEAARERENAKQNWDRYKEAIAAGNAEFASMQRSFEGQLRQQVDATARRDVEISHLQEKLKNYATWVGRILQCDFQIQPPEVALSKVAFVLELLRASLSGQTLEGAMQRLGYLETVFGFEAGPSKRKIFLALQKTTGLYKSEEGCAKMLDPQSTQIHGIKALRQYLNIGLREAKEITDQLFDGVAYKFECPDLETAQRAAGELKKTGYFMASIVEE